MGYKFDWESIIDRSGTHAFAVDVMPIPGAEIKEGFSRLPMWVADMNFETVPTIPEEMIKRAKHPLYGYFAVSDDYYNSIIDWHKRRNGVEGLEAKHIGYENGVLGGVVSAVKVLASYGDNILLHSPTYIGFTNSLKNMGYNLVHSELYRDEEGIWRMDYEDMDKKIKENKIHVAIFCTPHNPTGRVWDREEVEKAFEVYKANDVFVISDEIWSDIILDGNKHLPPQMLNEDAKQRTIALYAPSKTFNLAGLQGSYHIIYNPWLKDRVIKESSLPHYNSANVMSVAALIGAYKDDGHQWTDELIEVIGKNIDYAYNYINENFKGLSVAKPQGTYLLYIDAEEWCKENGKTIDELQRRGAEYGVVWQDGRPFNRPYAIRMNFALPYASVVEAFDRLDKYVFNADW
ncbi:MAG: aminotransferase class I/II-fold pyridoxal phosphate-dependent enzyme [Tissierellia bacterium]|nr:aminotransferase class I/II-fold pyridoxal phosphate-dependent enzyme [Tissierellia bacterium]